MYELIILREAAMKVKIIILTVSFVLFLFAGCDGNTDPDETGFVDDDSFNEIPDDEKPDDGDVYVEKGYPANIQRWPNIQTGQKKCFDGTGEIQCPKPGDPFFGQDGSYQYGVRSYIDNGNATVSDSVTSLIWQKGFKGSVTWYEAKNYCETLTLDNKSWRLPLTHELKSLVDYNKTDPAIDTAFFPGTPSDWFWASRHVGFDDASTGKEPAAWMINFYDGYIEYTSRYNHYNVRCVQFN